MAQVKISGRRDTLQITNEQGRKIKAKLMTQNKDEDEMIDLGGWFGYLSQIKAVEPEPEKKYTDLEDYNRELTPQEKINRAAIMKRMRLKLEAKGIIKPMRDSSMKQIGDIIK